MITMQKMNNMITLTTSQQQVFDQITNFLREDNDSNVFILKGYAGTGKTTMIKFIVNYLDEQQLSSSLMAPTGRAAKVLRNKLQGREATTIHSGIYVHRLECIAVEEEDKSKKSFEFIFPIDDVARDIYALIVDESSLISDKEANNEFFKFGSGKLLSDLLDFVKQTGVKKLIFVGDDAQLPPVADSESMAFNVDYLMSKGLKVEQAKLMEVLRQNGKSSILETANGIRELLSIPVEERNEFSIDENGSDIIAVSEEDLSSKYVEEYPVPHLGNGVILCYSNSQCYEMNMSIREKYFPGQEGITEGDVLLINSNCYFDGLVFYNGDMVSVLEVGEIETHKNIPVTHNGEKRHIDLEFQNLKVLYPGVDAPIFCKILLNLLQSRKRDLSAWEMKALYIDFCMRAKLKEGSEDFKRALKTDSYFNSLKVKYGYAITCHKAQGGEWNTVFVDFAKRNGLSNDVLRWCYTAITRSSHKLYVTNTPHITCFTKLKVHDIIKVSKAPKEMWRDIPSIRTPFHKETILTPIKLKCLGIMDALEDSSYKLVNVESYNYRERYHFLYNESESIQIDALYNGSGILNILPIYNDGSGRDYLHEVINTAMRTPASIDYKPSADYLLNLKQIMDTLCDSIGIRITNVVEDLKNWRVTYYLQTDARFASILFSVTGGKFTAAQPSSEFGKDDEKLKQLMILL